MVDKYYMSKGYSYTQRTAAAVKGSEMKHTTECLGTFNSRQEWLDFLEGILGSEGNAQKAALAADYLQNEQKIEWDTIEEFDQIPDWMYQKMCNYVEGDFPSRAEND